jgi:hypothetical protein
MPAACHLKVIILLAIWLTCVVRVCYVGLGSVCLQAESLLSSLFTAGSAHPAAAKMEPLATPPTSILSEAGGKGKAGGPAAKKARHA